LAGIGVSSAGLSRALAVEAERGGIDAAAIARAEWVSGVTLDDEQREKLARSVSQQVEQLERIRKVEIDADVPPATQFASHRDAYASAPRYAPDEGPGSVTLADVPADQFPRNKVELAFAPIRVLAAMLRQREVSSWELTELFLDRLDRHGKTLNCVVTLTEDLARRQARIADRELAAGRPRGPLHGIPWGAKDLIAVAGYPTTWGCEIFREQQRADTATVARRLEAAGAVLIAKLSLGAIAMGDNWFGGKTLNPWNLEQGSSGSSAGSAAATAAGLVPFSLGSETLGSIVSPARRCGATGLRPTFGRVSRHGCMPLAWSFDKIGPICRSVEDTAYVFAAIHGADGLDPTAVTHPFQWPAAVDLSQLRVGYTGEASDDREELRILREMGVQLKPIELPEDYPTWPLASMLEVESASMFYDVWKDGTEEGLFRWARIWQTAGFVPAIDYVRAMRVRTMLMQAMEEAIAGVDCYFGGNDLVLTNLTGHPTVVMPYRRPASGEAPDGAAVSGENDNNPQQQAGQDLPVEPGPRPPRAITFTGQLHGESRLLAVADAFQRAKGDHRLHPPTFTQP
jgi:Asp-tRNA(Asn)/Glu-tRNA(Gln) amidotransferase A subunit family amidase